LSRLVPMMTLMPVLSCAANRMCSTHKPRADPGEQSAASPPTRRGPHRELGPAGPVTVRPGGFAHVTGFDSGVAGWVCLHPVQIASRVPSGRGLQDKLIKRCHPLGSLRAIVAPKSPRPTNLIQHVTNMDHGGGVIHGHLPGPGRRRSAPPGARESSNWRARSIPAQGHGPVESTSLYSTLPLHGTQERLGRVDPSEVKFARTINTRCRKVISSINQLCSSNTRADRPRSWTSSQQALFAECARRLAACSSRTTAARSSRPPLPPLRNRLIGITGILLQIYNKQRIWDRKTRRISCATCAKWTPNNRPPVAMLDYTTILKKSFQGSPYYSLRAPFWSSSTSQTHRSSSSLSSGRAGLPVDGGRDGLVRPSSSPGQHHDPALGRGHRGANGIQSLIARRGTATEILAKARAKPCLSRLTPRRVSQISVAKHRGIERLG